MTEISPEVKALLGTMPDRQIARLHGLNPFAVFRLRNKLGIAPFSNGPRTGVFIRVTPELLQRIDAARSNGNLSRSTYICTQLETVVP